MAGSKSPQSARARNGAKAKGTRGARSTRGATGATGATVRVAGVWDDGSAARASRDGRSRVDRGGDGTGRGRADGQTRVATLRAGGRAEPVASGAAGDTGPPAWLRWATFGLAILGLAVSVYLTYTHYTQSSLLGCSESGLVNCAKVTSSSQSMVFGVVPVAVLGLAFYVFLVAIMSPPAWRLTRREVPLLRLLSMIVGMGFVLYLVYAELFQIGSICVYCTSVHAITFLLFVLTLLGAAIWGLTPQPAQAR